MATPEGGGGQRTPPPVRRPVRSFVRREGRLTAGQARALDQLWPRWGLEFRGEPLDLDRAFGRRAPRHLEIGFGRGESLLALAAAHPERDYLGIEVHRPGVGSLLLRLEQNGIDNVRIVCADAAEVLARGIPPGSLERVLLWFPDPWPKKRHHKRRLVQPAFADRVAAVLQPGGCWHLATDWEDYARHMMAVLEAHPAFTNPAGPGRCSPRGERPPTKYEQRGRRLGHGVWDLVYCTRPAASRTP